MIAFLLKVGLKSQHSHADTVIMSNCLRALEISRHKLTAQAVGLFLRKRTCSRRALYRPKRVLK